MSLFHKKEGLRKAISVVTLYAVFIQQIIPYGWSANNERTHYSYSYSSKTSGRVELKSEHNSIKEEYNSEIESTNKKEEIEEVLSQVMIASSGGGQAETSGFSLGSTDGMVNKFTGDFSYSIPLMDVEGYPIVLAYNSNIGMNSESSWVGLGWDLSVGAVSREMRGIPDEFNGEQVIEKEFNQLDGTTTGTKLGPYLAASYGFGGLDPERDPLYNPSIQLTALWGQYYSPMVGNGKTFDFGLQSTFSVGNEDTKWSVAPSFGIGYSRDSKNGIGTSSNFGLSVGYGEKEEGQGELGASFSKSFNSRVGLTSKSVGSNLSFGYLDKNYNGGNGGVSLSGSLQYGTRSMTPSVVYRNVTSGSQNSFNQSLRYKFGNLSTSVGMIVQSHSIENQIQLSNDRVYQPAIGYFHNGKRKYHKSNSATAHYPIMDFNRGTRNEYSDNMGYLDYSAQMYDIFRVSTGSYSATFRGRRTDIGTYHDAEVKSETDINSVQVRLGIELPTPRLVVGFVAGNNTGEVASGKKEAGTSQSNMLEFESEVTIDPVSGIQGLDDFDDAVYFKSLSEMTPEDQDALNYFGGEQATRFALEANQNDKTIDISPTLLSNSSSLGAKYGNTANSLTDKIVRSAYVKPITVADYSSSSPTYLSYDENDFNYGNNTHTITRNTGHREDNHISAIETMDNSGTRYVFGIPAYNLSTVQCMFAVDPNSNTVIDTTGLVEYTVTDASVNNTKGRSHLFERTTVPDYAHSFLLTEMLSSNYSDVTGDGPTTDDVGTWYKFNYTQVYGKDSTNVPYEWRYPVAGDTGGKEAFYDPATLGSDLDDKANYSYGEKEIWYVHTVESKNMIAEFHLTNRKDAYGVVDQNGQLDTGMPLKALDKIVLYNRSERINNPNAEPIQTVEFEYDYSLCKNAPANSETYGGTFANSGKLTLKAIRVYSGTSEEMALSSYEFTYSDVNPHFNYANIDGWGNYKPNDPIRPNAQYPYADQVKAAADATAQAWRLTSILNPAGGKTDISYEADSYGFVQNQAAMQHFDIHGMTSVIHLLDIIDGGNGEYTGQNTWFDYNREISEFELTMLGGLSFMNDVLSEARPHSIYTDEYGRYNVNNAGNAVTVPNNVIIFPLEDEYGNNLTWEQASQKVEDEYFKQFDDFGTILTGAINPKRPLYFKIHSEIDKNGLEEDYVPFFAQIASNYNDFFNDVPTFEDDVRAIGALPYETGQNYKYGYVILEPSFVGENMKKGEIPSKDRIQVHPLQKAVLEYARMNLPDVLYGACNGCTPDLSIDQGVMMGKKDVNRIMIEQGYAASMIEDMSVVRLASPDSTKYGGNGRVSQISYSDNWNAISEEYNSTYTWKYEYGNRTSTTGVASNEPGGIRDENALYFWATYQNVKEKFPDESKFMPLPVADLIYPAPVIGYETVQVEFEGSRDKGYSESNYYTSKDFPTVFKATKLDKTERVEKNIPILGFTTNLQGLSQGYTVITNDYHGKMKSAVTYDGLGNKQAQSIYEYYGLGDKVNMIDREGNVSEEKIAMEYDIHADVNYATSLTKTFALGADVKFWPFPPNLYFMISPVLSLGKSYEGFWSNTLVKHINKSAVVRNIQSWNMQSVNNARNLAFDRETGNVIVSSLQDEFDDTLYSFAYPAHWYYDQCRSVSEVDGFEATGNISSNQMEITSHDVGDYFVEGDYISISNGTTTDYAYILFFSGADATLINTNGNIYNGVSGTGLTITILESGRDNILGATMQSAVTKKKPDLSVGAFTFPKEEVISMSAMTLKDRDNLKCRGGEGGSHGSEYILGNVLNPYPPGIKGKLIGEAQYAYQSERINDSHAHGIRFDGTIDTLVPFYEISSGEWYRINESGHPDHDAGDLYQKWRNLGNTTMFDQFGKPLESKDQIDIRSTVLYGYNPELEIVPIAQAVNARKQEIAFDGFEDYNYFTDISLGYEKNHFSFSDALGANVTIDTTIRHSGLQSLKITSSNSAVVSKDVGETWENPSDGFTSTNFVADTCLCIPIFAPTPGDYVVGAWIKVGDDPDTTTSYTTANVEITVNYTGGNTVQNFTPSGPIIDGWQRVEGNFTIPANGTSVDVRLENNDGSDAAYFDDLRIHPFLAGMTTTVYDPKTLLPLATHDGYNFTTFYNYDENLNQVRVRVETIEGIKTVSEVEGGGQKRFN
ncbi:MAG: hypothetical protein ACFHU9_00260 [Fluviicola sp.]